LQFVSHQLQPVHQGIAITDNFIEVAGIGAALHAEFAAAVGSNFMS
jgi:hypothetical protein